MVFRGLSKVVPAELATLTLFEHDNPDRARTYFAPPQNPGSFSMARHEGAAADRSVITDALGVRWNAFAPEATLPGYPASNRTPCSPNAVTELRVTHANSRA